MYSSFKGKVWQYSHGKMTFLFCVLEIIGYQSTQVFGCVDSQNTKEIRRCSYAMSILNGVVPQECKEGLVSDQITQVFQEFRAV